MTQITRAATEPATPLHGITVLELGGFMAAPFGAMQLADLGADVIKIESPHGSDPMRRAGPLVNGQGSAFLRLNRNKRSIALDLKSEEGSGVLRRLVAKADVLIENLRPGALARLGFGYQTVSELNPRLVYVSASGWGQGGPLANRGGLDIMAQARSGLMSVTGTSDGQLVKIGVPICDLVCGLYVALGTMAALRARELTGEGQFIDTSLYESGVSFTIWEAGKYFATGEVSGPYGTAHQAAAPYQAFRTADGWITIGAPTDKLWIAACGVLGLDHLLCDARFEKPDARFAHHDELAALIEEVTTQRVTADLVAELDEVGVPCAPIARTDEVFTDAHLTERGFFWETEHPVAGTVRQLGSPMRMSSTPPVRRNAGPVLGADTRDVLAGAGFDDDEIQQLLASGAVSQS